MFSEEVVLLKELYFLEISVFFFPYGVASVLGSRRRANLLLFVSLIGKIRS